MGIPGDLMIPILAMARIAGWCAHIIEERFAEAQEKPTWYRFQENTRFRPEPHLETPTKNFFCAQKCAN